MRDLTPERFRCSLGGCPAVRQLDDGRLLIVGRRAQVTDLPLDCEIPISRDEIAIIVDPDLLANVLRPEKPA